MVVVSLRRGDYRLGQERLKITMNILASYSAQTLRIHPGIVRPRGLVSAGGGPHAQLGVVFCRSEIV
jgi:hypothetical protein